MSTTGENAAPESATKTAGKLKTAGIPLYYLHKDSSGYEHRVANMDNPIICERKGIVEIECIRKSNLIQPNFSICTVRDRDLNIIFGVPNGIDPRSKDIRWQRFRLGDFKRYDLRNNEDAVEWAIVRRAPFLQGSPYQKGKVFYKVHDKEAEARTVISDSKLRRRAQDVAEEMVAIEEMTDMYRNFGENPIGFSATMLRAEIIKIANRSPKEFLAVWDNANREVISIFNRCLSVGLVSYHAASASFMWKNSLPMGMTKEAAIKFLLDNKPTLNQAKMESESLDHVSKKIKSESSSMANANRMEVDEDYIQLLGVAKIIGLKNYSDLSKEELQKAVDKETKLLM